MVARRQRYNPGCNLALVGLWPAWAFTRGSSLHGYEMWPDNETERDFLNFSGVAETVAEIIVQVQGKPISIGVSGAWGVGKSSMIKLIRAALSQRAESQGGEFIFVEFNAWLYQGYDDARAALLEVIASSLVEEAERRKSGLDKAQELLGRVGWFRAARLTAGTVIPMVFGVPPRWTHRGDGPDRQEGPG